MVWEKFIEDCIIDVIFNMFLKRSLQYRKYCYEKKKLWKRSMNIIYDKTERKDT